MMLETLQAAFYVALPGAMFYIGGTLSRLSTRIDQLSHELDALSGRWETHLAEHHHIHSRKEDRP